MSTYPDHILRVGSQHLAELKRKAAEFERQLWDAHESLEQEMEMEQAASGTDVIVDGQQEAFNWTTEDAAGPQPRRSRGNRSGTGAGRRCPRRGGLAVPTAARRSI